MVVSGINAGANLGDDVLYSGTVAAAMEGRFLGFPAVAVSLVTESAPALCHCGALHLRSGEAAAIQSVAGGHHPQRERAGSGVGRD